MPIYEYRCRSCGTSVESTERGQNIICVCGEAAIRSFGTVAIQAATARHRGRWDPVVGEYVESERDFRSKLARGQQEQSEKLGMDVNLATVDARDSEGLAELHGWSADDRAADLEPLERAKRDLLK